MAGVKQCTDGVAILADNQMSAAGAYAYDQAWRSLARDMGLVSVPSQGPAYRAALLAAYETAAGQAVPLVDVNALLSLLGQPPAVDSSTGVSNALQAVTVLLNNLNIIGQRILHDWVPQTDTADCATALNGAVTVIIANVTAAQTAVCASPVSAPLDQRSAQIANTAQGILFVANANNVVVDATTSASLEGCTGNMENQLVTLSGNVGVMYSNWCAETLPGGLSLQTGRIVLGLNSIVQQTAGTYRVWAAAQAGFAGYGGAIATDPIQNVLSFTITRTLT